MNPSHCTVHLILLIFLFFGYFCQAITDDPTLPPPPQCDTADCETVGDQLVGQITVCDNLYNGNRYCKIGAMEFCISQLLKTQKKGNCVCEPSTCSGSEQLLENQNFMVLLVLWSLNKLF